MVTVERRTDQRSLMAHLMRRAGFGARQKELDGLEEMRSVSYTHLPLPTSDLV